METKMRRNDRTITEAEAVELLHTAEYGVLSLIDPQGMPYGVPLSFAMADNCLYFHGAAEGKKALSIQHCAKTSFAVVSHTQVLPEKFSTLYQSAIVCGTVQMVEDAAEKRKGLESLIRKYSPNELESGYAYIERSLNRVAVFKLTISSLTGKGRKK